MNMFNLEFKEGNSNIHKNKDFTTITFVSESKQLANELSEFEDSTGIKIPENLKKLLKGKSTEIVFNSSNEPFRQYQIIKVSSESVKNPDYFRNYFAGYVKSIKDSPFSEVHINIPEFLNNISETFSDKKYLIQSIVEGFHYGNYEFNKYKSKKSGKKDLTIAIFCTESKLINEALNTASLLMYCVNFTRNLQNEPGNVLYPQIFAERIEKELRKAGVKIAVLKEKEIQKRKMGGLWAVGKGSAHPPRMIILEYKPDKSIKNIKTGKKKKIALVGKGITFDTGGISIKPSDKMWEMKGDMSGAAVVAGVILAAAKAKLPIEILGVIAAAENMPSSTAYKPGDIITASNGKTIEIDNTDAEGRVVLADALVYACKQKPETIIDLATLTGSCVVALGEFAAGLFTKNDGLADTLYQCGQVTFDRVWRLPLWDDYHSLIKTEVADMKNAGSRWGGAISAAKFLENFVDPIIPWVHLDIAGPSSPHSLNNYTSPYFTGFGVRLLFDYLNKEAKKTD